MSPKKGTPKKEPVEVQDTLPVVDEQPSEGPSAAEVYAELEAAKAAEQVEPTVDPRIAELEAQLAEANARLSEANVEVPEVIGLDEPVISQAPRSKIEKLTFLPVATFRELGIADPSKLDKGPRINPETGGLIASRYIKQPSGNLIEDK